MPRRSALETLRRVDRGARAREVLDAVLRRRRLDPRDRHLAHELVQGTLRHLTTIDHLLTPYLKRSLQNAHAVDRAALRLGVHQLVFLDRVPDRAAVHGTIEAAKAAGRPRAAGFLNAVLRNVARSLEDASAEPDPGGATVGEEPTAPGAEPGGNPRRAVPRGDGTWTRFSKDVLPDPAEDQTAWLAAAFAHPRWLVERFVAQHGREAARGVLEAGIARPALSLRPTAGNETALREALAAAGHELDDEGPCLLLRGAGSPVGLPGYDEGWFRVQDPTAAEVVPLLDPQPGEGILDLCAAPGGKTFALAEAVGDDGVVLAIDRPGPRTDALEREARRRGLANVAVMGLDATDPDLLPRGLRPGSGQRPARGSGRRGGPDDAGFDAVLIDVPCSNTGVLAQRVEARHRLEGPHRIAMLAEQAAHLLMVAASRVRPGGRLLYSTCAIDREENDDVIDAFLAEDEDFTLAQGATTLPVAGQRGGGFAALLLRR